MSILTRIFGNYADDLAKAAAKTATKSAAQTATKTAAKTASKALLSQADDVAEAGAKGILKTATGASDDVAKTLSQSLADNADEGVKSSIKSIADEVDTTTNKFAQPSLGESFKGTTDNINIGAGKAEKATATQKLAEKNRQDFAASLGATSKQRKNLYTKYRLGNDGENIADYLERQNVGLANIGDKSETVLSQLGDVKNGLLQRAEDAGVTIDMPTAINWNSSSLKKADLKQINNALGIDLQNDLLNQAMTPTQAEKLYLDLRNRAYTMMKNDNTSMAGEALKKAVDELGDKIDDAVENAKVGYGLSQKTAEAMSNAGLDPKDIRKVVEMGDNISAKDLRTLQQPWVIAKDMVGNKAPKEATLNIAGIDTGLPNYIKKATEGVGNIPLKAAALMEKHPGVGSAALVGAGVAGGSLLGSLLASGNQPQQAYGASAMAGGSPTGAGAASSADVASLLNESQAASEPNINGYTLDDLETAYFNAMMAGDSDAAKIAGNMIDVLNNKIERTKESTKNSGIASKQKSAINVLNNLMGNFKAKGTVSGNVGQFLNMVTGGGFDPQQFTYDTGSKGSLGPIIKALGDSGMLSEGDQQRALQLIPSTTDAPQAAQMKYQQLLGILESAGTQ